MPKAFGGNSGGFLLVRGMICRTGFLADAVKKQPQLLTLLGEYVNIFKYNSFVMEVICYEAY